MVRVGDVVLDKYRIERQLGSGGMGVVLQATHLQLNQPVALKFLVDSGLDIHVASERFLREARATFRLRSEHTVRVMDVGTLPTGEPFMVMELLEGLDFKQLVAERGPLPPAEASLYVLQVCAALQEAHASGIVHRDLKARNLFLTKRVDGTPCVKVLDFGISKVLESSELAPLTQPDMGMGSPRYMAPEQWASAATVDARADIYATGAVFYELLTGQIPLAGLQLAEVIKRIRAGAVPSPREIRGDLPDALCRVVMKALRPRPEERFPTALHFAQAIREAQPDAEAKGRPKPVMAMTVPTAVVNREVLLARAQIDARIAAANQVPTSQAPTPQDPRPLDARDMPPTSTLDEGVPAVSPPSNDFAEDAATIVTHSAMDQDGAPKTTASPAHARATLQVPEAPPELQALRYRMPQPAPPQVTVQTPTRQSQPMFPTSVSPSAPMISAPMPAAPLAMPSVPMHAASSTPGLPETINQHDPVLPRARKVVPSWLFWTFLVVSFLVAGGVVAAVLTRYLQ